MYLFEANLNLLANSTPAVAQFTTKVEPNCQLPSLLVHWSYRDRNIHAILYKYGDVCPQIQGESRLQWLHLQAELHFWGFVRCHDKHILVLRYWIHRRLMSRIFRIALFTVSFQARKLVQQFHCAISQRFTYLFSSLKSLEISQAIPVAV